MNKMIWRIKVPIGEIDLCFTLRFGAIRVEISSNMAVFCFIFFFVFVYSSNINKDRVLYPFVTVCIEHVQLSGRQRLLAFKYHGL